MHLFFIVTRCFSAEILTCCVQQLVFAIVGDRMVEKRISDPPTATIHCYPIGATVFVSVRVSHNAGGVNATLAALGVSGRSRHTRDQRQRFHSKCLVERL
jgi:hypothetical protein